MTYQGYWFGFKITREASFDGRKWLCAVIWYPKSRKQLGYLYPSIRWF